MFEVDMYMKFVVDRHQPPSTNQVAPIWWCENVHTYETRLSPATIALQYLTTQPVVEVS